jgi:hypothetical protein
VTPACQRLLEQLEAPSVPPELSAHVDGCRDCRAVWEAYHAVPASEGTASTSSSPVSVALSDAVRGAARTELEARPRARSWRVEAGILAGLGVGFALGMALAVARLLSHSVTRENVLLSVLPLALGAVGTYFGLAPGRHLLRKVLLAVAGVAALAIGLAGLPGVPLRAPGCAFIEILAALLPVALGVRALRHSAFNVASAALVGVSTAAIGLVVVQLSCPEPGRSHLVAFHLVPWALVALVAWWVRRGARTESYAP